MKMQQGIDNIKTMKELEERKARQKEIFDATFEGIQSVFDKYYAAVNKDRNKFDYAKFATETGEAVNKELQRLEKAALTQLERKEFEEKQVQELKGLGWIQWNGLIAAKIGSDFAKGMGEGRLKEQQKSEEKAVKENIERLAKEQRESGVQSEDAELQSLKKQIENLEAAKKSEIEALENKSVKKSTVNNAVSKVMTNVMSLTSSKKAKEEKKAKEAKKSEDIAKAIKGLEDRYALEAKKLAEQCKALEEKIERQNLETERLEGIIIGIYNDSVKAGQEFSAENCSKAFHDKFTHLSAALQDNDKRQLEAKLTTMFESLHKSYKGEKINDDLAKIKSESSWLEWIRDLILLLPSSLLGVQTNSMRRNTFKKSLNETEKTVGSRSL